MLETLAVGPEHTDKCLDAIVDSLKSCQSYEEDGGGCRRRKTTLYLTLYGTKLISRLEDKIIRKAHHLHEISEHECMRMQTHRED